MRCVQVQVKSVCVSDATQSVMFYSLGTIGTSLAGATFDISCVALYSCVLLYGLRAQGLHDGGQQAV